MIHIIACIAPTPFTRSAQELIRTNVLIDEKKLKAAKKEYDISTTKEIIDFALTEILKTHRRKKILNLKGKVKIDLDLDSSREAG